MIQPELTGTRDLKLSQWVRDFLPDTDTGFIVSDIDFYIYNWKTKTHALVEQKTRGANLKPWQRRMYGNLNKWISGGGAREGWHYAGFFFIQFENTFFDDGRVYLNGKESSEEEIRKKLSL